MTRSIAFSLALVTAVSAPPTARAGAPAGSPSGTEVPSLPLPATPRPKSHPPRGLGLLVPGVLLLGTVVAVAIADIVILSQPREGTCDGCIPISVFTAPLLVPGIPLTAVGAHRAHRYRQWQSRLRRQSTTPSRDREQR